MWLIKWSLAENSETCFGGFFDILICDIYQYMRADRTVTHQSQKLTKPTLSIPINKALHTTLKTHKKS